MSLPTLTPKSTKSAIVLPVTGTTANVISACPIGAYTGSVDFVAGCVAQVAFTYKKLGGDVLDIELTEQNVYANYEEAVMEYSYIVNLHQAKNTLGSALGAATSSFNHQGDIIVGQTLSGSQTALKYPKFRFEYAMKVGDSYSHEAAIGGVEPIYSASFARVSNQQDYDLQAIVENEAATNSDSPFYGKVGNNRIKIRQVYYVSPAQMWRFYGYYGGLNVVGDFHNYGQYADDSTFNVIPAWQNKLQAVAYEDHLYTRTSHYSYEIIDNKLRLFPIPNDVSPSNWWFRFSIKSGPFTDEDESGQNGVNNINTLPFENIPYENINSMGKQWIRRFALALSKETLGQIRGKFGGTIPIPGESVTLNASDLLSQAKEMQDKLRDELKTTLDEMTYDKIVEKQKNTVDNASALLEKAPLKIFVG